MVHPGIARYWPEQVEWGMSGKWVHSRPCLVLGLYSKQDGSHCRALREAGTESGLGDLRGCPKCDTVGWSPEDETGASECPVLNQLLGCQATSFVLTTRHFIGPLKRMCVNRPKNIQHCDQDGLWHGLAGIAATLTSHHPTWLPGLPYPNCLF